MSLRTLGILSGLVFCSACNDPTGLRAMAGKYVISGWEIMWDIPATNPILPGASYVLDSLQDTIILKSNSTYQEVGAAWGHDPVGEASELRIDVHGTVLLDGSTITLVPDAGSTIAGGTGTLKKNKLVFDRSPARWTFTRR